MLNLTGHYALIMAFYWSNLAVLSNYASVFLLEHGFQNTEIGLMIAVASLLSALLQPLLGAYADKPHSPSVKTILMILIALFFAAVILILDSAGRSKVVLTAAYALALMLMNTMAPFANVLGTLAAGAGYRVDFGIARGVGSLAYAGASVLIGSMTQRFNVSLIPIASIAIYAGFGLCLWFFPFRKQAMSPEKQTSAGFMKKYPRYVVILIAACFLYASHVLICNFSYQIISSKGGNSESLGIAYAIAAVAELPMMFSFTRLLKRMSAGRWLVISGFAYLAKTIGTLFAGSVGGFYAVQTLQLLAYAVLTVASVYYIDSIMAPEDAIKGQAFFTMTNMIGSVSGSALGGILLDAGGVKALLRTAVGFAAIGAGVMCFGIMMGLESREKRRRRLADC